MATWGSSQHPGRRPRLTGKRAGWATEGPGTWHRVADTRFSTFLGTSAKGLGECSEDRRHVDDRDLPITTVGKIRDLFGQATQRERHLVGLAARHIETVTTQVQSDLITLDPKRCGARLRIEAPFEHRVGGGDDDADTISRIHHHQAA